MTNTKRWLDELPLDSSERELLLVGKSARPAEGAVDANWRALCVALGTTAAASSAASAAAASNALSVSASTKVASAVVASKAASVSLVLTIGKSLAVGAVVGLAAMGAGSLAERSLTRHAPASKTSEAARSLPAPRPAAEPRPTPSPAAEPVAVVPGTSAQGALPASSSRERAAASPTPGQLPSAAGAEAQVGSGTEKTASLSQEARELAELKRLIDSGASSEALRRLERSADPASVLSEERDALYIQALARAQRQAEARAAARRFLARYPHSPYYETIRQLLSDQ